MTSTRPRHVLVVGSYPPVPTAGAAVTEAIVRRLWTEGAHPHVAAPRPSAAPLTVAVAGLVAGRRLARLRSVTGATEVVLCAERDMPIPTAGFPAGSLPLVQRLSAHQLCAALDGFDHVTLVACGDHRIPAAVWDRLVAAADTVIDRSDAVGTPGVTTLGPPGPVGPALMRRAEAVAPRLLGRHTPHARRLVLALRRLRPARRAA